MRLHPVGVDLCLRNADRLRRDARGRSLPTKLALYELALEELGKGHMILLRLQLEDIVRRLYSGEVPRTGSDNPGDNATRELLESKAHLLSDDAIAKAFRNHDIKLEFVELLVDVGILAADRLEAVSSRLSGWPLRYRVVGVIGNVGPIRRLAVREMRAALQRLKSRGFESLDTVGKRATFVDLVPGTGQLEGPFAEQQLVSDFAFLIRGLRMPLVRARIDLAKGRPISTVW